MQPRDARLAASPGLGPEALDRLRACTVAVIGVGVLGGAVLQHLALLGIRLRVIDPDVVDTVNTANQMFPVTAVGEPKAVARARQVRALNPDCPIEAVVAPVEALGLAALADADLLITGLDGRAARAHVNRVARLVGRPWLDMAVDGSGQRLFGTVTLYDLRRDDAACFVCKYDADQIAALGREGRGPGCPNWRTPGVAAMPPTLQTSAFGGVVAGFASIWAVRALLGQAADLPNRQLVIEADATPRTRLVTLTPNPHCAHPRVALTSSPAATVGDLLAAAARDLGEEPAALGFPGRLLVSRLACPHCLASRDLVRVAETVSDEEVRCACGTEMAPAALSASLQGADLARARPLTWRAVGVPPDDVVGVRAGAHTAHYIVHGRQG